MYLPCCITQAFRNGHFRLTKQIQGDAEVHEVSVPPFSVGAAAISVHRWLSELTEQLSSGAGFSKPRIGFTVWRGKHGREARHSTVKSAVLAMLAGIQSQGDTSGSPSHSTASSPMSSPAACKGVSGILPASATSAAPPVRIIVAQTPFTVIQDSPQVNSS